LCPVWPLRDDVPRAGHQPGTAPVGDAGRPRAGNTERGRTIPLRALRGAIRYAAGDRRDDQPARHAFDVRRRGTASHPDVRRLSRDRHDAISRRNLDLRSQAMSTNAATASDLAPEDEGRQQLYVLL